MKKNSSSKTRLQAATLREVLHDVTGQFSVLDVLSAIDDFLREQSWDDALKEVIQEAETVDSAHIDIALRALMNRPEHHRSEKLRKLAAYLRSRVSHTTRCIIINTLVPPKPIESTQEPLESAQELVHIATDPQDDYTVRLSALHALKSKIPSSAVLTGLPELINPELFRTNSFSEQDVHWVLAVLNVIKAHPEKFSEKALAIVESLVYAEDKRVCCCALEVAGALGEIDAIERLCMAVAGRPELQTSFAIAVACISGKPISVRRLRWENFERLIQEMLRGIGHFSVEVTQSSHDNGVDVISKRKDGDGEIAQVLVQCKLRRDGTIGKEDIEQLRNAMQKHKAKEGVLMTTGGFSQDAKEYQQQNQFIRLLGKKELQQRLDKVFGEGRYKI